MLQIRCPRCNALLRFNDLSVYVELHMDTIPPLRDDEGKREGTAIVLIGKFEVEETLSQRGELTISCWSCTWEDSQLIDVTAELLGSVSVKHMLVKGIH